MALKQTRRAVSLNREVYSLAKAEAEKRDITLAHFVENCIRAEIALPATVHATVEASRKATVGRLRVRRVSHGGDVLRRVTAARRAG